MRESDNEAYLSCYIKDSWATARVCEILADFSAADERLRLGSGFVRLKKAAADLRKTWSQSRGMFDGSTEAMLVLAGDHQALLWRLIESAGASVTLSVANLRSLAQSQLMQLLLDRSLGGVLDTTVQYGSPAASDSIVVALIKRLAGTNIKLQYQPGACADWVLMDKNYLVIFGDGDVFETQGGRRPYAGRVSFAIRGKQVEAGLS